MENNSSSEGRLIKKSMLWKLGIAAIVALFVFLVVQKNLSGITGNAILGSSNDEAGDVQVIDVGMIGGKYTPSVITVEANKPVILQDDGSLKGCARVMIQPELGMNANFVKNSRYQFTPTKKGTFTYTCSMGMYKGVIKVI
ncbi:cupredoxin domain-containing protein [Candidatus Woesearchaeota archaeon]|nr:cupredoxin domain-containing protein [Candidatus Woesearchaeota archaeon]